MSTTYCIHLVNGSTLVPRGLCCRLILAIVSVSALVVSLRVCSRVVMGYVVHQTVVSAWVGFPCPLDG